MTDKQYPYDPDLPYVVLCEGDMVARFAEKDAAYHFESQRWAYETIDTTPAPRVDTDAQIIMWEVVDGPYRVARRNKDGWQLRSNGVSVPLEDLPGVTPDTVFTVLDERKS